MIINKIRYKNKIDFDYFEVLLGNDISIFDHETFDVDGRFEDKATCVLTQICPWCVKKYDLYKEVERTPEDVEEEIEYYTSDGADPEDLPEDLDEKCGIDGCMNGAADYVDLDWKDFEIIERK